MSNRSEVFGTMTLEGHWSRSMIMNLNVIKNEWSLWNYSICVDDFNFAGQIKKFTANGCWRFDTNLGLIGKWTLCSEKKEVKSAYDSLCAEMMLHTDEIGISEARIELIFVEEEGGSGMLREASGEINCKIGKGLQGLIINVDDYTYSKENLVKLGFCNSIDDIDWI